MHHPLQVFDVLVVVAVLGVNCRSLVDRSRGIDQQTFCMFSRSLDLLLCTAEMRWTRSTEMPLRSHTSLSRRQSITLRGGRRVAHSRPCSTYRSRAAHCVSAQPARAVIAAAPPPLRRLAGRGPAASLAIVCVCVCVCVLVCMYVCMYVCMWLLL